ncbi:hypothetical protein AFK24_15520 [Pseudomonas syringae]|uniref:Uncharacterized protein n=1 Tax=Pseudomonas syringae TaxID=317 RepID=A0A1C7Z554_PSESX|nr:hypothetical protein [Pseudomonas syringae]OCR24166.1 hypothetical protein AFK24_15520 [Pseudomonas syringae]
MGIPRNYYLKGYVDYSKPGQIETLYKEGFASEVEILTSCVLSPQDVFVLVERLSWTSIDGDIVYHLDGDSSHVMVTYPFSRFWGAITDLFYIGQYSEEYSVAFHLVLTKKLQLADFRFPHFIRIKLPTHQLGEEFDAIKLAPHDADIDSFECRADIISHATYIEGMLYKIIIDSRKRATKPIKEMTYNDKIKFCRDEKLLSRDLLSVVRGLKNLRNEAAHQFSFESSGPTGNYLKVNPVSDKLLTDIKVFVDVCEKRYSLSAGRINRFHNCLRMLAGELNKKAELSQQITIGKQYPEDLSSYFYG